jgi:hypothetical protein
LASESGPAPKVEEKRLEAERQVGFQHWSQYLKTLEVDGALYFDEGGGELQLQK